MSSSERPLQPTVEDASDSPPPLPSSPPPPLEDDTPADQPIDTLGDGSDEEEDEEEWDPSVERLPGQDKAKAKATAYGGEAKDTQGWQAVWAPEQNAWYFWNANTGEVTWTNPLDPSAAFSSSTAPSTTTAPQQPPLPAGVPPPSEQFTSDPSFGLPPDIDPSLAYLLPPEQRGFSDASAGSGGQAALFNARTGRFTPVGYEYTVSHLDEYNRAKRMSSHYFDVDAWEREKQEEHAKRKREEALGDGPSKKKLTKKDMDRFRRKAAEKKQRQQAWLRD